MKHSAGMSGISPVPFEDLPVLPLCLEGPVSLDWLQKWKKEGGREGFECGKTEGSRFIAVSGQGRGGAGKPGPPVLADHSGEAAEAQGAVPRLGMPRALTQAQRSTWKMEPSMPPQNMWYSERSRVTAMIPTSNRTDSRSSPDETSQSWSQTVQEN